MQYLGVVIKPGRITIANRTKGNFSAAVRRFNQLADARKPSAGDRARFQSSINSYLGVLRHYATVRLRGVMIRRLSPRWWRYFDVEIFKVARRT